MPAGKEWEAFGKRWEASWTMLDVHHWMLRQKPEWLEAQGRSIYYHQIEAQKLCWPEDDVHRWLELGLKTITANDVTVFLGCSDSSKTYTISRYVLTDWWSNPDKSLWLVSSTELRGAELRIWGVLKQLFNRARANYPDLPGQVLESMHCITTERISEDNSEGRLLTKGIIFVPCKKGNTYIGLGALQGIKPQPGGRLGHAGDEVQAMPRVFLDAYSNWYGKEGFKGIMSGNPFDLDDSLCVAAEPIEGWAAWKDTEKTQTWRSKFYNAAVVAFDGRDSPNFDYPSDKPTHFSYLIGRKKMNAVIKTHGAESWQVFNQCIGKPRPGIAARRVVTRSMCEQYHAFDDLVWLGKETIKIGSCDAAYGGVGGDRCVAEYVEFGKDINGHVMIVCHPPVLVPVSVKNAALPENQIAEFVKTYMESVGVLPNNFFFDGRGSLAVAFARVWSNQVESIEFGGVPTERPVSNDTHVWDGDMRQRRLQRCNELYDRFVTELWFAVHYSIISDQVRKLPRDVCDELCRREWDYTKGNRISVETKADMKERTGESPDLADTLVCCFEGARRRGFQIQRLPGEAEEERDHSWKHDLRLRAKKFRQSYQLTR